MQAAPCPCWRCSRSCSCSGAWQTPHAGASAPCWNCWPVTYRYGGFHWWVTPDVPLAIVAAWGALLYAAIKYSDGLYALILDLAMELVAVRLGLWRWAVPVGGPVVRHPLVRSWPCWR